MATLTKGTLPKHGMSGVKLLGQPSDAPVITNPVEAFAPPHGKGGPDTIAARNAAVRRFCSGAPGPNKCRNDTIL